MDPEVKELLLGMHREYQLQGPSMKEAPAFYRNLEQTLDLRRSEGGLLTAKPRWADSVYDFTSSDFLSLNRSNRIRDAFLAELAQTPDFRLSASGSRVQYGNYDYLNQVEQEIASFYGSETAYIAHSGWLANVGVLAAVPLPGDAIVYDELVHASTHEGMKISVASHRMPFLHNDPDSLRDVLSVLRDEHSAFQSGTRSVLICVESVYSMDGDVCPLKEMVQVAKELFPLGNAQFIIDEAHSTGTIGPKGAGLVAELGLEKDIAIRLHMSSKALGATGGVILCAKPIRTMILNHARFAIYSGAPSYPMVACIRAGYQLMSSGQTQKHIQLAVRHFFKTITSHDMYEEATDRGIFTIPLAEDWETRPFMTHIVAVRTKKPRYEQYLFFHLLLANINAYATSYPTVPKGQHRVRVIFHAHNTIEQVDALVAAICEWAREMVEIEDGESEHTLPGATRQVYALEGLAQ
ncbi:hypothetical protein F66182_2355 [Fusarium sp. NRRL 66182]|nr:hypothetical protein F66182_2355 [Fusarium sp. NRRL 66182]